MKKLLFAIVILLGMTSANAQDRTSGQAVVPRGYESEDSIRFHVFNMQTMHDENYATNPGYMDSVADDIFVTFEGAWGDLPASKPLVGKRKGIMARNAGERIGLGELTKKVKQRVYYASPEQLNYHTGRGLFWRYNDLNIPGSGATWHYNKYDANDISPYAEYPANTSIVAQTFLTRRFNLGEDTTSQTARYGDEGRVILGWSDNRNAVELSQVMRDFFPYTDGVDTADRTPRHFSTHLEFNIDTGSIDESYKGTTTPENLPLLRVQIIYKKGNLQDGEDTEGWPATPLVPFKSSAHPDNPGWWLVSDQIVTKAMYDTLPDSWRTEDVLESGSPARSWNFKQLYLRFEDVDATLRNLITNDSLPGAAVKWGGGAADGSILDTYVHPDELAEQSTEDKSNYILEIRVLSTYRAKVRVRSLAYQDIASDRYFLRIKSGDSSLSCNVPAPGVFSLQAGGNDDSVKAIVAQLASMLDTNAPREILINDTQDWENGVHRVTVPQMIGYVDYLAGKRNIHVHYREQDIGDISQHLRRARLSYDGKPPSLFENQATYFFSWTDFDVVDGDNVNEVLGKPFSVIPRDYVPNWALASPSDTYPHVNDKMFNILVSRSNMSGDPLQAYKDYTDEKAGLTKRYGELLRRTAQVALKHPKNKRFAVEYSTQAWFSLRFKNYLDTVNRLWHVRTDSAAFSWRPTTPEEVTGQMWMVLANGYTSFNNPEPIGYPSVDGGRPGLWTTALRTDFTQPAKLTHDINFGHFFGYWMTRGFELDTVIGGVPQKVSRTATMWKPDGNPLSYLGDSSTIDDELPEWYLGISNNWRATKRVLSRINQIYSPINSNYPFKRLEWLDAYSTHRALTHAYVVHRGPDDSISRAGSFLKVMQTSPVERWERGPKGEYLDSAVVDSVYRTYVEVGLFRDRLSGTIQPRGYAALVVNTRLWPGRDSVDLAYYNEGLAPKDRLVPTLGDIDVRKVYMKIDPTKMHDSMKSTYYVVRDIWHPDTCWRA